MNTPFAYVALPAIPTDPISPSDQPGGSGVIVKVELFTACPFTVTVNAPEDAAVGTSARMLVSLQFTTPALVVFNETVLLPCVVPNPDPVIVTKVPTGPEVGEIDVILGA